MNRYRRGISRRTFLELALSTPLALSSMAQKPEATSPENINELLAKIRDESGLPSLAAAAMKDGELVALGAVGFRKVSSPISVETSDKYHIGSCTKAMTATLVAKFFEIGRLNFKTTLAEIFPERVSKMNEHFRTVTLESLLLHRSGMRVNAKFNHRKLPLIDQRLAYLDSVVNHPPEFPLGEYHYSNAGYVAVGAVLERVTGKPWETLMRTFIFKRLGMKSAGFGSPSRRGKVDQPWGHVWDDGKFQPHYDDNPAGIGPAGTVHCSISDYLKFADFHASCGNRPVGFLSPGTFLKLHRPPLGETYALGWGTGKRDWARGHVLTHVGSNNANYFVVWIAPEINFSVAAATNAAGGNTPAFLDQAIVQLANQCAR